MRILALALGIPFPPIGGGLTRTFHLLKALATHHDVVLAAFDHGEAHEAPAYPLELVAVPWRWGEAYLEMNGADPAAARRAYERLTFQSDDPWFVSVMDPAPMEAALPRVLTARVDVVVLHGTPLAHFIRMLPPDVPRVLDLFDVQSLVTQRVADNATEDERPAALREAERTLTFERRAVRACAACLAVSEEEAAAARDLLGAPAVHVVPNGVDTSYFTPSTDVPLPGTIVFTGRMTYKPNADAAVYFAREVLPLVRREAPHARFHVVGADPPEPVSSLASDAVIVHGRVDDVRPHLRGAEVIVVPVTTGGGTRLKALEAAASGKAIVSTPLGIEGLSFRAGEDALVGSDPPSLAAAVVSLLHDPARRREMGDRARRVALGYDWMAIGEGFRRIVEDVAAPR